MEDDSTSLYLKLVGGDISPKSIRMKTLFGVLGGIERTIELMGDDMGIEFDENEAIIVPNALEDSSLGIPATINRKARDPLRSIDHAFYADDIDRLPTQVRSEFRRIQSTLGGRGTTLEMSGSQSLGLHGITLSEDAPHIPDPGAESDKLTSHAVVYGICVRVNRTRHDARIQLHDGTGCRISSLTDEQLQELMKRTGADLDQVFRVEGEATWNVEDYRVRQIDVTSIRPVERDAGELFDALREATGNTFDEVDPIEFVNELRGK